MPESRIPASAGSHSGELRLTSDGLTFVPVTSLDGDQMCLNLSGWHLSWHEITGFERVMKRRGEVRVHYAASARFMTVTVAGSLQRFFDEADAFIAAAAQPARDAA